MKFDGAPVDTALVRAMADKIRHRGPDDWGIYRSRCKTFAFASRRLAIIDLTPAGHMPLTNETGEIWVAFNGEIYNHPTLRRVLEKKGHHFKSRTDTEVIVHAYEEYGISFLNAIEGMFAIALWDERKNQLILVRDRLGKKPLYYSFASSGLVFASEIKSFIDCPGFDRKIDLQALSEYLTFGFVMPPRTLYHGVCKLGPGEYLSVSKKGEVDHRQYWSPVQNEERLEQIRTLPLTEHIKQIRRILEESVASRMIADVPIGAFLSGGIDSSTVVALMSRLSSHPVETVTVFYPQNPDADESSFASLVANKVGAKCQRIPVSEDMAIDALSECIYYFDEPISDPACVNTFYASAYFRREGILVSLVGEGADELFIGYPNYLKYLQLAPYWTLFQKQSQTLKQMECRAMSHLLKFLGLDRHLDLLSRAENNQAMFLSSCVFFLDRNKWQIFPLPLRHAVRKWPAHLVAQHIQRATPPWMLNDTLALMSLSEVKMRLAEKLLMRIDKMSMAHSIEVRAPFLDHKLVEYVMAIPGHIRSQGGRTKSLLRSVASALLPKEIIDRHKMGFSTPIIHWFRGKLGAYFEHKLQHSGLFRDGVLAAGYCKRLLEEHRAGVSLHHHQLWTVLVLAEWYDRFRLHGFVDDELSSPLQFCVPTEDRNRSLCNSN